MLSSLSCGRTHGCDRGQRLCHGWTQSRERNESYLDVSPPAAAHGTWSQLQRLGLSLR